MMCYQLNGDTMWECGREYKLIDGRWVEADKLNKINQAIKETINEKQTEQQMINQNQEDIQKVQIQQDVKDQEDIQNQQKEKQSQLDKDQK
ncbi:unnamed protein product [Paramecium sonneborni]|uniref:Uncharacterized protein n=1 Tax=Paramecium sonneborni TaxID=65129 RepID=A0A8S1LBN2_9CILI|nr:unnamed protein product [Paramecium sonneborni]